MTEKLQPRKTKRPMSAREMAEKFKVSERSVRKWWSQSRADYLASAEISHGKLSELAVQRGTDAVNLCLIRKSHDY